MTNVRHVSEKTVPLHRLHIQPDEGSNCIMTGYRADVRTDSSIRSSSSILVEACSITEEGVVNTMPRRVDEDEGAHGEKGDCLPGTEGE
mmetsp:Transcript_308/g.509  ORF Transcript_308/g.509 Transcript_308/m.509 type:complete len:89 (-) Transcript_308:464-730(-)